MANTTIEVKVTAEFTFDPPDSGPGWYVDVYTQVGDNPRSGRRLGPVPFEELERIRTELMGLEINTIKGMFEHMKRNLIEE